MYCLQVRGKKDLPFWINNLIISIIQQKNRALFSSSECNKSPSYQTPRLYLSGWIKCMFTYHVKQSRLSQKILSQKRPCYSTGSYIYVTRLFWYWLNVQSFSSSNIHISLTSSCTCSYTLADSLYSSKGLALCWYFSVYSCSVYSHSWKTNL